MLSRSFPKRCLHLQLFLFNVWGNSLAIWRVQVIFALFWRCLCQAMDVAKHQRRRLGFLSHMQTVTGVVTKATEDLQVAAFMWWMASTCSVQVAHNVWCHWVHVKQNSMPLCQHWAMAFTFEGALSLRLVQDPTHFADRLFIRASADQSSRDRQSKACFWKDFVDTGSCETGICGHITDFNNLERCWHWDKTFVQAAHAAVAPWSGST